MMGGVWWLVVAALATVAADEATDPEGLLEPGVQGIAGKSSCFDCYWSSSF